MSERIEGHWPKFLRAEEHLADIRSEIDFYREGEPCRITGKFDTATQDYVIKFESAIPTPVRLPILIGDCVFNLRACLDHLLHKLIAKWNPSFLETEYGKRCTFPIHESCITAKGKTRIGYSELTNFPQATRSLIMGNQPCCRGDMAAWHPLALIQSLNNADKHRVLALTTIGLTHGAVGLKIKGESTVGLFAAYVQGSFKVGDEVVRRAGVVELMRARGVANLDETEVYGYLPSSITFDEPDPPCDHPVLDVLDECVEFVRTFMSDVASSGGLI